MNKYIFVLFFYFCFCERGFAQINLVPNPSFEIYSTCPTSYNQIDRAAPWFNPASLTPDFFNSCATILYCDVPSNNYGTQSAHTGVGYAGIYVSQIHSAPDTREYISVKLIHPLQIGVSYCVNFYVNLSDSSHQGVSSIGAYFSSTNSSSMNGYIMNVKPQIANPATNPLLDKNNWMLISGTYIASGDEQYITIGNFSDDSHSGLQTVTIGDQYVFAYFYIDDVSVMVSDSLNTECSPTNINKININQTQITISPDRTNETFSVNLNKVYKNIKIQIKDQLGKESKLITFTGKQLVIEIGAISNGIYYLHITDDKRNVVNKKIIIK